MGKVRKTGSSEDQGKTNGCKPKHQAEVDSINQTSEELFKTTRAVSHSLTDEEVFYNSVTSTDLHLLRCTTLNYRDALGQSGLVQGDGVGVGVWDANEPSALSIGHGL